MPTLVVVRHAKADRPGGVDDLDRPLLRRGRADAQAAGEWVAGSTGAPGLVVTSPALRTRETVEGLQRGWGAEVSVVVEERIYEASLGDLLRVVRGLDDDEGTIALVGHDPGLSLLVAELTGSRVELPTCGVAVIEVPSAWADTPSSACRLVASAVPRGEQD
ncbi:phosphohistidine phosphatase [Motilibacter rhizosphaerae]|uniref:Phosphohistidine phosphatase n=1 Tax=Motilibacter rhizosphaerae TaxID=598652 RepID=A0A4Q7NFV2_9ACTN|nr:histidine phosphatase family protein [Motilibacter rhizosphaerae]RZS82771.1 phosphohistidine phosphatase [Motilibacter rhizosphaerae]